MIVVKEMQHEVHACESAQEMIITGPTEDMLTLVGN